MYGAGAGILAFFGMVIALAARARVKPGRRQ
jgi:hypothetical protein